MKDLDHLHLAEADLSFEDRSPLENFGNSLHSCRVLTSHLENKYKTHIDSIVFSNYNSNIQFA